MDTALNSTSTAVEVEIRVTALERIVACSVAELAGTEHQIVALEGRPLALIGDDDETTALVSRSGAPGAIVDLVATLIAARPSGLLVFGDDAGANGLALRLRDGLVTAVMGPGPFGTLGAFVVEFHQRRLRMAPQLGEGATAIDPCRAYALETALTMLTRCNVAGATMLWLSGPLQWLGEELPPASRFEATFLLLELARRSDELPRMEKDLGGLDQVVVPMSRPAARPLRPAERPRPRDPDDDWDFFDDPDPAAESEWADARVVFECCDGVTTVEGLADATMLGRFRTVGALVALLERGHVTLMPALEGTDELADLVAALGDVA